ncbi:hypothetical protein BKA67DRAFT_382253 [Truncatella angustata]|uniref:Uncharacterized protein n=1 Tax=Truncatella angustata TaxID=152316 RepID=A0A9P8UG14_9PEZI|nr:uncharacterized protein BKA67DRAFT_382253 [Truncatella angustata]KAH6649143.1 hypothetical protein BKA67DRAFT_382253 [Truncatella angustata]
MFRSVNMLEFVLKGTIYRASPEYIESRLFNNGRWRPQGAYAVAVKPFPNHHIDVNKEADNLCAVGRKLATHSHVGTMHRDCRSLKVLP